MTSGGSPGEADWVEAGEGEVGRGSDGGPGTAGDGHGLGRQRQRHRRPAPPERPPPDYRQYAQEEAVGSGAAVPLEAPQTARGRT